MNFDLKWLYICSTVVFILLFVASERFNALLDTVEVLGCLR